MTFLDGWERIEIPGHGGGAYVNGSWRIVLHSTEGLSIESAVGSYTTNGVPPQLTIDPLRTRKAQHISLDRSGYAMVHPKGGPETNRLPCVQIEIVMFADEAKAQQYGGLYVGDLTDEHYAYIAGCIAEVRANGVDIADTILPFVHYPESYGAHAGQRLSAAEWVGFDGICGHQHVFGNDHGDPGNLDHTRITASGPAGDDDNMTDPEKAALFATLADINTKLDSQQAQLTALTNSKVTEIQKNLRRVAGGLDAAGTRVLGIEGKVAEYPGYRP